MWNDNYGEEDVNGNVFYINTDKYKYIQNIENRYKYKQNFNMYHATSPRLGLCISASLQNIAKEQKRFKILQKDKKDCNGWEMLKL